MKNSPARKIRVIAAIITFASFAGTASAQGSVTLYGAIDTAVAWFSHMPTQNGGSRGAFLMTASSLSQSMWGLRGTEELGHGFQAIFTIENGFNPNNGESTQGNRLFGSQAYIGLSSASAGTVTLGRQYDPLIDLLQPLTGDATFGSAFSTPGDIDNYDSSYRTSNSVKFISQNYAGWQFGALYAPGGEGGMGRGQTYAGAVVYNNGPLGLGAGYFRATNGNVTPSFDGLTPVLSTQCGENCDSAAISGTFSTASSIQIVRAAANYKMGKVTAGASYSNVQYRNYQTHDASSGANRTSFNTGQVFVNYRLTPAVLLGAGYDYTKGSGNQVSVVYHQFSLGVDYALSKRTDLYALGGYQRTSGKTWQNGQLLSALASMGDYGNDASGAKQGMVMVGLRHSF